MGLIYMIIFQNRKKYIGQTRQLLKQRVRQHICCKDNTLVSRAFKKYKNYEIEILIEVEDNNLLDDYETKFIETYQTLAPNGYNVRTGGQQGYIFTEEIKKKCSESQRKHEKSLPMYIYKEVRRSIGYRCRPPDGREEKYFTSKDLTDEINLSLAKEYLLGEKDDLQKRYLLPKFISKVKRDNRSGYRVTLPGKEKYFSSNKFSDKEKLTQAINYLKTVKNE